MVLASKTRAEVCWKVSSKTVVVLMNLLEDLKVMLGGTVDSLRINCKRPKGKAKGMAEALACHPWATEPAVYLQASCVVRKIKPSLFRPLWSGFLFFLMHY